jgi:uncharacterized membrane protein YvlD (DUF360 family)
MDDDRESDKPVLNYAPPATHSVPTYRQIFIWVLLGASIILLIYGFIVRDQFERDDSWMYAIGSIILAIVISYHRNQHIKF